ncbi:hypothetical protein [Tenacibaculum discolor]|uniref:hypothetical protein n=1 Tax=Tenacibaculum discolor TaxID=361581 RepID=UPI000F59852F|nr:hypothetical protein [Tenacibaculum discolor]
MKTVKLKLLMGFLLLMVIPSTIFSQEENQRPEYITVTTGHWNLNYENFNKGEWIAVEKEFLDKVVKKNEFILKSFVFLHRFTPDNTEIIFVNTYSSWDNIDKAYKRSGELAKEAWPDKDERAAYFKKKDAYYTHHHSDEIYAPIWGAKMLQPTNKEMIWLVVKGHFAFPEDGSMKEFDELSKQYLDNVIQKNEFIKGFYQHGHAWGSDRTEYTRAYVIESMGDLDKMGKRSNELYREHWSDEAKRKEFGKKMSKYFTGKHGDYIYTSVPELTK